MSSSSIRLVILWALVTFVYAQPQQLPNQDYASKTATIIHQVDVRNPDGSYHNSYETSNGIKVENSGNFKTVIVPRHVDKHGNVIEEHETVVLVQSGSYSYVSPEGYVVYIKYIADENGFQPQGKLIPTSSGHLTVDSSQHQAE